MGEECECPPDLRLKVSVGLLVLALSPAIFSRTVEVALTEEDRNLKTVNGFWEAFNRGDVPAALGFWADPVTNAGREVPRAFIGKILEDIRTRTPDVHFTVEEMVAAEENVIVRGEYSGTHLGIAQLPIDGGLLVGVPPTGKKFVVQHTHWFKLKNGLIADHRASRDDLGMMIQLGLIIPPHGAAAK
jgi:predicted ester cyclase